MMSTGNGWGRIKIGACCLLLCGMLGITRVFSALPLTTAKPIKHKEHTAKELRERIAHHLEDLGHVLSRGMQKTGSNMELMLKRMRELLEQDRAGVWGMAGHKKLVELEHRLAQEVILMRQFEQELAQLEQLLQGE